MDLLYKVLKHLSGGVEIGDNPVFHRSEGGYIGRRLAEHSLGLGPDGYGLSVVLSYHDYRRFIAYNALALHVNQSVGCAQIYSEIVRE
jgi:hypothetical protein